MTSTKEGKSYIYEKLYEAEKQKTQLLLNFLDTLKDLYKIGENCKEFGIDFDSNHFIELIDNAISKVTTTNLKEEEDGNI